MTNPHPAALTPEQRAELAWSEGWGCSRETQVSCVADAIRAAVAEERKRCEGIVRTFINRRLMLAAILSTETDHDR